MSHRAFTLVPGDRENFWIHMQKLLDYLDKGAVIKNVTTVDSCLVYIIEE